MTIIGVSKEITLSAPNLAALESRGHPAHHRFDHVRVRDDVLPGVGAGAAFVVFLHPVGLEDHPVAGADEVGGQRERGEGAVDEGGDRAGISVARGSARDRNARVGGSEGIRVG